MSAPTQKCVNEGCKQFFFVTCLLDDTTLPDGWYRIKQNGISGWPVCSPSCLVEFSWWLKENQAKLSKSKPKAKHFCPDYWMSDRHRVEECSACQRLKST